MDDLETVCWLIRVYDQWCWCNGAGVMVHWYNGAGVMVHWYDGAGVIHCVPSIRYHMLCK